MSIKLIAMDMDGTLLGADYVTIPPRNVAALRTARARGVKLAIASGRTWSLIGDGARQLGGVDYAMLSNGAAVRETATGRPIYEKGIPNPQAKAMIRFLRRQGLAYEVYCGGENYVEERDRDLVLAHCVTPGFHTLYESHTTFVPDLEEKVGERDIEKVHVFYIPEERTEEIRRGIEATGPVSAANAFMRNMEFAAGGVNKGVALRALAAHLGLGPEEVMAFGDAGNDIEMLRWAHWSFAMANGAPEVRAAARYQAPANHEAGVGQMVEQFVLKE